MSDSSQGIGTVAGGDKGFFLAKFLANRIRRLSLCDRKGADGNQKMIHVKVRIFSQAIPDRSEIELEDGSSVETLLVRINETAIQENLGSDSNKIAFLNNTNTLIVLLNGLSIYSLSGWKTVLREGDEVSLLPMVAGG